jgi:hypothetical protein
MVVGVSEMDKARWLLVVGGSGRLGGGGQWGRRWDGGAVVAVGGDSAV